jgi:hypothetical protein
MPLAWPQKEEGTMAARFRPMKARYAGRCPRCRGEIRPGEEIVYAAGRGAFHPACAAAPAPKPAAPATPPAQVPDPRAEADRLRAGIDFDALRALDATLHPIWVQEFTAHNGFGPGFWPALRARLAEQGLDPRGLRAAVRAACGPAAEVVLAVLDGRAIPNSTSLGMSMAFIDYAAWPARQALGRVARYWRDLTLVVVPMGTDK